MRRPRRSLLQQRRASISRRWLGRAAAVWATVQRSPKHIVLAETKKSVRTERSGKHQQEHRPQRGGRITSGQADVRPEDGCNETRNEHGGTDQPDRALEPLSVLRLSPRDDHRLA